MANQSSRTQTTEFGNQIRAAQAQQARITVRQLGALLAAGKPWPVAAENADPTSADDSQPARRARDSHDTVESPAR